MKDTIKNSIIGAFAIFGFVALISSSNTTPTVIHEGSNTPESHVWEFHLSNPASGTGANGMRGMAFAINKVTGEVRKYESNWGNYKQQKWGTYVVSRHGQ
tara:strand:+ start:787 stop:1086 length:300 start_codon:yes stop_codon:yes gene_type:complete